MMLRGLNRVLRNLNEWEDRMRAASYLLAQNWAGRLEGYMKRYAPWTDRTGAARAGLYGTAELDRDEVVIRLGHTVDYGVYLELAHDGKYAIIELTRRTFQDDIVRDFRELWGG